MGKVYFKSTRSKADYKAFNEYMRSICPRLQKVYGDAIDVYRVTGANMNLDNETFRSVLPEEFLRKEQVNRALAESIIELFWDRSKEHVNDKRGESESDI